MSAASHRGSDALLASPSWHGERPGAAVEIDLIPSEVDQLGHAQAVAVATRIMVASRWPHRLPLDQLRHLSIRQVFPCAQFGIGPAQRCNCPVVGVTNWRCDFAIETSSGNLDCL
jgi:hypothetical protein